MDTNALKVSCLVALLYSLPLDNNTVEACDKVAQLAWEAFSEVIENNGISEVPAIVEAVTEGWQDEFDEIISRDLDEQEGLEQDCWLDDDDEDEEEP